MSNGARRLRRAGARPRADLPWHREFVMAGPDETVINVPRAGAIFVSLAGGYTVIECAAYSGPGVAERKAILEARVRAAGLGYAVDAAHRRAREAA